MFLAYINSVSEAMAACRGGAQQTGRGAHEKNKARGKELHRELALDSVLHAFHLQVTSLLVHLVRSTKEHKQFLRARPVFNSNGMHILTCAKYG